MAKTKNRANALSATMFGKWRTLPAQFACPDALVGRHFLELTCSFCEQIKSDRFALA